MPDSAPPSPKARISSESPRTSAARAQPTTQSEDASHAPFFPVSPSDNNRAPDTAQSSSELTDTTPAAQDHLPTVQIRALRLNESRVDHVSTISPDVDAPAPTPPPSTDPWARGTIDASAFPHIIARIMTYADTRTRLVLRQLNRTCLAAMDTVWAEHAVIVVWWNGEVEVRIYKGPGVLFDYGRPPRVHSLQAPNSSVSGSTPGSIPGRVADILGRVTALDIAGHFNLGSFSTDARIVIKGMLGIVTAPRGGHQALQTLRFIPDPFGRHPWRGKHAEGAQYSSVAAEQISTGGRDVPIQRIQGFASRAPLLNRKISASIHVIVSLAWCPEHYKVLMGSLKSNISLEAIWELAFASRDGVTIVGLETIPEELTGGYDSGDEWNPYLSLKIGIENRITRFEHDPASDAWWPLEWSALPESGDGEQVTPTIKYLTHDEYVDIAGPQEFDSIVKVAE